MKDKFIKALENNNLLEIKKIPKSDLHNHALRGGNKRYIEAWKGVRIPKAPIFKNLNEMNKWYKENIKLHCNGRIGYEKRIEAAFVQAKSDGVQILNMSFSIGEVCEFENSAEDMVKTLKNIHKNFATDITFIPEIALETYTPINILNEGAVFPKNRTVYSLSF